MSSTSTVPTVGIDQGVADEDFELRFCSLFSSGKAMTFPCDRCGRVDMDSMSEPCRNNYLAARALIGREFAWPVVLRVLP